MPQAGRSIGVVVAKRASTSAWQSEVWSTRAVLPDVPPIPAWTRLPSLPEEELYYAGELGLALHSGDTSHYRDNLAATPSIWVQIRPNADFTIDLIHATVDPYEGESLADSMTDRLDAVPMPGDIAAWLADFVAEHHVERPFFKRQRNRQDPDSLGRRRRVGGEE